MRLTALTGGGRRGASGADVTMKINRPVLVEVGRVLVHLIPDSPRSNAILQPIGGNV